MDIKVMPMLVLRGIVVFPGATVHFDVVRDKSIKAIERAMQDERTVFLAPQTDAFEDNPPLSRINNIGCVGVIKQVFKTPGEDSVRVIVEGKRRARVDRCFRETPYFSVSVQYIEDADLNISAPKSIAYTRRIKDAFDTYAENADRLSSAVISGVISENDPAILSDYIAANLPLPYEDKIELINTLKPLQRAQKMVLILARECRVMVIDKDIQQKVQEDVDNNQRDYYLKEQLRVINGELGLNDDEEEIGEYREKISSLKCAQSTKDRLLKDVDRLEKMAGNMHEGTVLRAYLDTVTELPFGVFTKDKTDVKRARAILEKDHFGLDKVKRRFVEMVAVQKLAPNNNAQILCLVGPPGVGKTSIAASVAACLGRKFQRISLGGIKDEAEIRGHRRTYVGAMPGRLINAVINAGTANPLILLDEIDKIGNDFKGDCSAALLEALDPEQNVSFCDHYIDVPFDLSNVLFITTANDESAIPAALHDRMEVIELASYTTEEKFSIAKKHLIKKQLKKHGLTSSACRITDGAVYSIIEEYTREGGVRNLERNIAAVCRKAAAQIAEGTATKVVVTDKNISDFLGNKKILQDKADDYCNTVGTVNGLAWTSVGGEIMRLEAAALAGTGKIELTGSLGDVMKESAKTAVSYVRSVADELGIDADFYKNRDIHIHATEAAVPKDGPSAGVTMATALISALTGVPVRHDVAMTGEITLRGNVLPIGGLKEKTMAAYRFGIKTVIIPSKNKPDLSEIDKSVRDSVEFVVADDMNTVLEYALASNPRVGNVSVRDKNIIVQNSDIPSYIRQ